MRNLLSKNNPPPLRGAPFTQRGLSFSLNRLSVCSRGEKLCSPPTAKKQKGIYSSPSACRMGSSLSREGQELDCLSVCSCGERFSLKPPLCKGRWLGASPKAKHTFQTELPIKRITGNVLKRRDGGIVNA